MINFKALTLAALTAATALGGVAEAGTAFDREVKPFRVPTTHRALAQKLNDIGVRIWDGRNGENCKPDEDGYTRGYYNYVNNYVVLCTNNGTMGEMLQTLTHEAVHVVQDCYAGGIYTNDIQPTNKPTELRKLAQRLPAHKAQNIMRAYDQEDWDFEVEAFYFETSPSKTLAGLNRFCF